jgi:hypothetical protein
MLLSPKEQQRYLILTQAVINLAANTPHARTIVAHHKHSPVAGLIEAAPLGLALFEALIHFALYSLTPEIPRQPESFAIQRFVRRLR